MTVTLPVVLGHCMVPFFCVADAAVVALLVECLDDVCGATEAYVRFVVAEYDLGVSEDAGRRGPYDVEGVALPGGDGCCVGCRGQDEGGKSRGEHSFECRGKVMGILGGSVGSLDGNGRVLMMESECGLLG
jgi:hypothetical protein